MSLGNLNFKKEVLQAYSRIRKDIIRTSLNYSPFLSQMFDARVYIKWENEQVTGSFKFRGALNKLRSLEKREKLKGIISASTGNHGLGLSRACHLEGVKLTLFLPENAAPEKIKKLRDYKVSLKLFGLSCEKAEMHARQKARDEGQVYVSPYNDYDIVYGQGTIGVEILEDLPDVDDIIVPLGGGGLVSGIAGYLKSGNEKIRIFGVEPENSCFMAASLASGKIVEIEEKETLAEAVAGGIEPGAITFPLCQKLVDEILTVKEEDIKISLRYLFKKHKKIVEGAGALSLAGLMKKPEAFQGRRVVLIASGGNISQDLFQKIIRSTKK